jgi:hypothetical protein
VTGATTSGATEFGSCCTELKEALAAEGFDPLVTVAESGVLYLTVGLVDDEDDEGGSALVDHPMFFCPFCGTRLQTAEDVKEKLASKLAE